MVSGNVCFSCVKPENLKKKPKTTKCMILFIYFFFFFLSFFLLRVHCKHFTCKAKSGGKKALNFECLCAHKYSYISICKPHQASSFRASDTTVNSSLSRQADETVCLNLLRILYSYVLSTQMELWIPGMGPAAAQEKYWTYLIEYETELICNDLFWGSAHSFFV